jgi:4-coumarate--CoA ligase
MSEFVAQEPLEYNIPDDLTIPQFCLDYTHPLQTLRPEDVPLFIDDASGKKVSLHEVSTR